MEGAAEGSETADAVEAPRIKSIENERPVQQPESCSTWGTSSPEVSQQTAWPRHFSLLRSPDLVTQTIAGRNFNYLSGPLPGFLPICTSTYSDYPAFQAEELILNNYRSSNLSFDGSSSSAEPLTMAHLWANFTKVASRPREKTTKEYFPLGHKDVGGRGFLPPVSSQEPLSCMPLESKRSMIEEQSAGIDNHSALDDSRTCSSNKIKPKASSACGFQQFFIRSSLKGKGVACKQDNCDTSGITIPAQTVERPTANSKIASNSLHRQHGEPDNNLQLAGGGGGPADSHSEGIVLREWLKSKHQRTNKVERWHLFKQILGVVDDCHSQGLALQHLRPSYFLVLPLNQVKYIGSFIPQGQMELPVLLDQDPQRANHLSKRKMFLEQNEVSQPMFELKHQRLADYNSMTFPGKDGCRKNFQIEDNEADNSKTGNSSCDVGVLTSVGSVQTCGMHSGLNCQQSMSELVKLEETWYASPEELDNHIYSFSSNIYSLGVLFFELFCYLEAWEMHCAAMSDVRHRILPPNFLSENPKEAGFCLWLLHPEPHARPKSRDIILSELVNKDRDLSTIDNCSMLIEEEDAEADLLLHFLLSLKEQKEKHAADLETNLEYIKTDLEKVERRNSLTAEFLSSGSNLSAGLSDISVFHSQAVIHEDKVSRLSLSSLFKDKFMKNIEQLENAYFSMRSKLETSTPNSATRSDTDVLMLRNEHLQVHNSTVEESDDRGIFFTGLCNFARYSKFEVCGGVKNIDILNCANVICSLSFDRDEDYFAAAGVSKKIKIFEFSSLLDDTVDIHYPLIEMSSRSKLSCVCWNGYIRNYLASTDYEGVIQLWDASTGQGFTQFTGHKKRAWSVNFSQLDPTMLASGSDDFCVKLWGINDKNCVDTIRNIANVCCVQYSPHSSHLLSFGTANYRIYCYDLRNTRIPWCSLVGHGKAVSFVKFLDAETIVSASTDNTLKIWDLKKTNPSGLSDSSCSLTLRGHKNEKNFVGLSVCDDYIACGSETNETFAYHRGFPMPMISHKFGSIDPITGKETSDDGGQFVSSVCWRCKSNMVVAANSTGSIKVLQLV